MNGQLPNFPTETEHWESRLVWDFFGRLASGTFVDVGANHPVLHNMTWFLEQQGWAGVLVELHPELAEMARQQRPRSRTFQVAAGSPAQTGEMEIPLAAAHSLTTLRPDFDAVFSERKIRVPVRTLDSMLTEGGVTRVDFLSLDVEGAELDVLAGFDLAKWRPQLILIEDFLYDGDKRAYLRAQGYRLIRRTDYNNWYVPRESPHTLFNVSSPKEIFNLARKLWISGPIIGARRNWRRRRAQKN